jgi:hypothetical protein
MAAEHLNHQVKRFLTSLQHSKSFIENFEKNKQKHISLASSAGHPSVHCISCWPVLLAIRSHGQLL